MKKIKNNEELGTGMVNASQNENGLFNGMTENEAMFMSLDFCSVGHGKFNDIAEAKDYVRYMIGTGYVMLNRLYPNYRCAVLKLEDGSLEVRQFFIGKDYNKTGKEMEYVIGKRLTDKAFDRLFGLMQIFITDYGWKYGK